MLQSNKGASESSPAILVRCGSARRRVAGKCLMLRLFSRREAVGTDGGFEVGRAAGIPCMSNLRTACSIDTGRR